MNAELVLKDRIKISEKSFVEIAIWKVPMPLRGSFHQFKYRLAFVKDEACLLRYDNEAGKGDHKHLRKREFEYRFSNLETLYLDFWNDVERLNNENTDS